MLSPIVCSNIDPVGHIMVFCINKNCPKLDAYKIANKTKVKEWVYIPAVDIIPNDTIY